MQQAGGGDAGKQMDIHVHLHDDPGTIVKKLNQILAILKRQGVEMSAELDALKAEVERDATVNQSAITLLTGLSAQIAALKTDPAALQALSDELRAQSDSLAAAVTANTSATP